MKQTIRIQKGALTVPAEVLAGTELGLKWHVAVAAKLSARTMENLAKRRLIPVIRISPRCVRYHVPTVLAALRKLEVHAIGEGGRASSSWKKGSL